MGSWYLMYLEITRWHHVKPSLAFNSDPDPVSGVQAHPGLPLIVLYVGSVAAPLVGGFRVITYLRGRGVAE